MTRPHTSAPTPAAMETMPSLAPRTPSTQPVQLSTVTSTMRLIRMVRTIEQTGPLLIFCVSAYALVDRLFVAPASRTAQMPRASHDRAPARSDVPRHHGLHQVVLWPG